MATPFLTHQSDRSSTSRPVVPLPPEITLFDVTLFCVTNEITCHDDRRARQDGRYDHSQRASAADVVPAHQARDTWTHGSLRRSPPGPSFSRAAAPRRGLLDRLHPGAPGGHVSWH